MKLTLAHTHTHEKGEGKTPKSEERRDLSRTM